jgi:hypothetical protein
METGAFGPAPIEKPRLRATSLAVWAAARSSATRRFSWGPTKEFASAGPRVRGGSQVVDAPSGETRLQHFDFATRRSATVARNLGNLFIGLTVSPDGRAILYIPGRTPP